MSRADWVSVCDSMMASFGDIVRDATYYSVTKGSYDSNTGGLTLTKTPINTRVVFIKANKRLIPDTLTYEKTDRFVMLRGSDFLSTAPKSGDEILIDSVTYEIRQILPDEVATGAYYEARMSVK